MPYLKNEDTHRYHFNIFSQHYSAKHRWRGQWFHTHYSWQKILSEITVVIWHVSFNCCNFSSCIGVDPDTCSGYTCGSHPWLNFKITWRLLKIYQHWRPTSKDSDLTGLATKSQQLHKFRGYVYHRTYSCLRTRNLPEHKSIAFHVKGACCTCANMGPEGGLEHTPF